MTLDEYDDVIWEMDYGNEPVELRMAVERFIATNHRRAGDRFLLYTRRDGSSCERVFDGMWDAIHAGEAQFGKDPDACYDEFYVARMDKDGIEDDFVLWMPEKMYRKDWFDPRDAKPCRDYEDELEARGCEE